MELLPKTGVDLKIWLESALARYALGGVSIREVSKAWLENLPAFNKELKGLSKTVESNQYCEHGFKRRHKDGAFECLQCLKAEIASN